jgi:gliding motility-associated-like protein
VVDTSYYIKAEKTAGCFAYDTIHIKVYHSLPISLGKDTSFCTGDSLVLDAGAGFVNYTWNTGTNAKVITVKNKGTYTIAATGNNGCISFDTLKVISLYANPSVQLAKDSLLCFGESKILDAGIGYKQYSWSNGNTTQKIASKQTGKYFVSVIDNNGCKASDTTMITRILDLPHDFLSDDTSLCTYSKINLSPQNNYNSYQWSTSANTRVINIDKAGIYWLKVTDQYGCKGVDSIIIHPKQCMEGFYIPNAFTPNKDGKNDVFRPLIFGDVTKYHFTIYNRWGEKVYESTEPGEGWNGKYNSLEDKTSVFVWTCEYQLQGQPLQFEKGTVTLIR